MRKLFLKGGSITLFAACALLLPTSLLAAPAGKAPRVPVDRIDRPENPGNLQAAEPPWCRNWYPDCDADGYGDGASPLYSCKNPNWTNPAPTCKYLRTGTDCDDTNVAVNPAAEEGPELPADGIDNDCDGLVDIDCDGKGGVAPRIQLLSPNRGLFTSTPSVTVSGIVYPGQDESAIDYIAVNGVAASAVACSEDGGRRFDATVPLATGVQTLEVIAQDESSRTDRALTSVVYSSRFSDPKSIPVKGSLVTLLNQGSWNVLADYIEGTYTAAEIQSELLASNPLVNESGDADCVEDYQVYANATGYTHADTEISFTVTGGRIVVSARVIGPQMWATGWGDYDLEWYCGGWSDRVNMSAYVSFSEVGASANGWLSLDSNGQIRVSFTDVSSNASGIHLDVDADDWYYDWIIDLFEDYVADELEQFIEEELRNYVSYDLGPDLAAELNSLDLSYTVDLSGVPYGVSFTYDTLNVNEGSLALGLKMGLGYTVDPRTPANPGAVGQATNWTGDNSYTLGFRIGDDFFNSSLHALWEGGSLYLSDTLWEDPVITGSATPLLPPVLVPGASPYLLDLDLGDVIADMSIQRTDGTTLSVQAALSTGVSVTLTPIVEGYTIRFDVAFGESQVNYDLLGSATVPTELVAATEAAMGSLMDMVLLELEVYLESLTLSYLDVPLVIQGLSLKQDPANPAMLSLNGTAVYAGP